MAEIKREERFLVINLKDLDKYLSMEDTRTLNNICRKIRDSRLREGKGVNKYVVCNQDEPYADKVWEIILQGEREKHQA